MPSSAFLMSVPSCSFPLSYFNSTKSHLNNSALYSMHQWWILQAFAQICFLYLTCHHINQLFCTVTSICLLLNVGQVWVQNERPLLSLNSFHRNISSSLCSTLILFSPSSFQILEILDLIQSLIQMPFHPIKYFWLPFSR